MKYLIIVMTNYIKKTNTYEFFEFKENYVAPIYNILLNENMPILSRSIEIEVILSAYIPSEYFNLYKIYKYKLHLESLFEKYYKSIILV